MEFLSKLKIAKFKFIIQATQSLWLPEYKGSTFRGAFGITFKRIVCVNEPAVCEKCIFKDKCAYYAVFESPNPGTLPELDSPKIPHPFLLEPPLDEQEHFPPGEQLTFYLTLVGKAINYLPYFIYTFDRMGKTGGIGRGRGKGQGRFQLGEVFDGFDEEHAIYDGVTQILRSDFSIVRGHELTHQSSNDSNKISLEFITPTRIKHHKRYLLKDNQGSFDFQLLIENLYRRIYCLAYFHGEPFEDAFSMPRNNGVEITASQLKWQDWERYSHRQQARMKLGGFVGSVVYQGKILPWLPLIKAGEILHVGKATAFGLGKYVIN